jgi:hypothetical protein
VIILVDLVAICLDLIPSWWSLDAGADFLTQTPFNTWSRIDLSPTPSPRTNLFGKWGGGWGRGQVILTRSDDLQGGRRITNTGFRQDRTCGPQEDNWNVCEFQEDTLQRGLVGNHGAKNLEGIVLTTPQPLRLHQVSIYERFLLGCVLCRSASLFRPISPPSQLNFGGLSNNNAVGTHLV